MQPKLKKKLSLLLVVLLIVSLFSGLQINAAAETTTACLAFTSDVHHDTDYKQNNLDMWLKNLKSTGGVSHINYMGFCGDMGSAYDNGLTFWTDVQTDMSLLDGYIASGYIGQAGYTLGNHEWFTQAGGDYGTYSVSNAVEYYTTRQTCDRYLRLGESTPVKNSGDEIKYKDFRVYCFGSWAEVATNTSKYGFADADIAALGTYLASAPKNIPIFIMSHYPLHSFGGRTSINAGKVIDLLNNYPNVVFLWGHNHSVYDTNYDTVNEAGDTLDISGTSSPNTTKPINFTYTSAGCMSDSEYGAGSHFVVGKGLVAAISDIDGQITVNLTHYDMNGKTINDSRTIDMSKIREAHSKGPYTVRFKDGHTNQMITYQTVSAGAAATEPQHAKYDGYLYTGWDQKFDHITQNITVTANYIVKPEPLAKQSELNRNFIYLTLYDGDKPADSVYHPGTPIILYPVAWTPGMTIVDAVTKLHEKEYKGASAGFSVDTSNGFACFKTIWGHAPKYNTLAFNSKGYVDAAKKTQGGDIYYLLAYDTNWTSTSFIDPNVTDTVTGKYVTMQARTMNMNSDYTYTPKGYAGDIYVGTTLDNLADSGTDADASGTFTLRFDKPGTYYVMDKSSACGDAVAVVNVTPNNGDQVYVNLFVDGEVAHDQDGNDIAHYPMVLRFGDTINDIMAELHAHGYGKGSAWTSYEKDGSTIVTCLWGINGDTNCANIYLNNSAASVSAGTVLKNGDVIDINGYTTSSSTPSTGGGVVNNTDKPAISIKSVTSGKTTTSTVTVTGKIFGSAVSATVDGKTMEALMTAAKASENTGNKSEVVVSVSAGGGTDSVSLTIPAESLSQLADTTNAALTISSELGSIRFKSDAVDSLKSTAGGKDISVSIRKVDTADLPAETRQAIGERPVYDLSVTAGGVEISAFSGSAVTVRLPYKPASGETPDSIVIDTITSGGALIPVPNCLYNPAAEQVTFMTTHFSRYAVLSKEVSFSDVAGWSKDYVNYLAVRGIVTGSGGNLFNPDGKITRAQCVQILANLSGADLSHYKTTAFSDVGTPAWYCAAIGWASENGLVLGSNGRFNPDEHITRQDLAVILTRYAAKITHEALPELYAAPAFTDESSMSGYAADAVKAVRKAGIISGYPDGSFAPYKDTSRAEAAKMITVFVQGVFE